MKKMVPVNYASSNTTLYDELTDTNTHLETKKSMEFGDVVTATSDGLMKKTADFDVSEYT